MDLVAALLGQAHPFERACRALDGLEGVERLNAAADEVALGPDWDGEFVILAYPPGDQEDGIIRELAADRHVLAVEHLAVTADESHRCVTIALNRGLRLAVLKLTEPVEPQIEQFAAWIDGGDEPEHSGRRWLSTRFEASL